MIWCSDFETTTDQEDCRVWAWKSISIDEKHEAKGLTIEDFLEWCESIEYGSVIYFHNLKFDGEFILCHLLSHDWEYHSGKGGLKPHEFTTLIGDMGQWYSIDIRFSKEKRVYIYDSLKIWNFSIDELAKSFKMDILKESIDYEAYRAPGYEPTPEEWHYIDHDVRIACRAMQSMISRGFTKMTAGSNALSFYKDNIGKKFRYWFPGLDKEIDAFIRKSYRGGWVYANPAYQNKEVGKGIRLDVNSLYPSRMYDELMPYGMPLYFEGKHRENKLFPLYVQKIEVDFTLKKNHFPTIQQKGNIRFGGTEYIKSTNGEAIELILTNVDLELMFECYDINSIEYIEGYYFHGGKGMFNEYIDYWMEQKEQASLEHDTPKRNVAKLFMNSLYGKFATRPEVTERYPELNEDGSLHIAAGDITERDTLYIPVGTFVTAYARAYTIRSAIKCADRFLYADTDSLHLLGLDIPNDLTIHDTHLGAWKREAEFAKAIFIGAKCYAEAVYVSRETLEKFMEEHPNSPHADEAECTLLEITCAGMPAKSRLGISFEDFRIGLVVHDKLVPKHVPGGIVLKKTTFEIKTR